MFKLVGPCLTDLQENMGVAFKDGINYFRAPSEVAETPPETGEVFRLGGLVVEGSLVAEGTTYKFDVTDGGATVSVKYSGILPDLFSEGQGMIGLGQLQDKVFVAREILAKHDEQYMPKEVADALKAQGLYKAPKN